MGFPFEVCFFVTRSCCSWGAQNERKSLHGARGEMNRKSLAGRGPISGSSSFVAPDHAVVSLIWVLPAPPSPNPPTMCLDWSITSARFCLTFVLVHPIACCCVSIGVSSYRPTEIRKHVTKEMFLRKQRHSRNVRGVHRRCVQRCVC